MAKVGVQRAAELTGKSKSTIQRAMKSGKLSFDPAGNGRKLIDVSELERVYGLTSNKEDKKETTKTAETVLKEAEQMIEMERLRMQVKLLETQLDEAKDQINDLKAQREQWQKQAAQVLLTSQHSQKQAEAFKQELDQRKKEAMMRRQEIEKRKALARKKAEMQARVKTIQPENQNTAADTKSFWGKLTGRA